MRLASIHDPCVIIFTILEQSVLNEICSAEPRYGAALRSMLDAARLECRENTGHGFYTRFHVDRSLPPFGHHRLAGPFAQMIGMGPGQTMGFILWFENGYPATLEGYQNADDRGKTVDLKYRDLTALSFEELWWH